MKITRHYNLKQAERYQNLLYSLYHSVQLVSAPPFCDEVCRYTWEVRRPILKTRFSKDWYKAHYGLSVVVDGKQCLVKRHRTETIGGS